MTEYRKVPLRTLRSPDLMLLSAGSAFDSQKKGTASLLTHSLCPFCILAVVLDTDY